MEKAFLAASLDLVAERNVLRRMQQGMMQRLEVGNTIANAAILVEVRTALKMANAGYFRK